MKKILLFMCVLAFVGARAQTLTDGLMMGKGTYCTGFLYSEDSWKKYWEGTLNRENANIGTVTTRMLTYVGNYGVTAKLNVIAMVPYVWTKTDQGTLSPMEGVQDLTIGVKYKFYEKEFSGGKFKAFGLLSGSIPLTNYSPDFLPLSLGLQSKTFAPRLNVNYSMNNGFYATMSGAYVMRSNIKLDRPSYYTDDQLFLTDEVAMPDQFSFFGSIGRIKNGLQLELNYTQQNTLGGGDIRRQDMPFASNRMNYGKLGALAMYYMPFHKNIAVRGAYMYTIAGRNVGQSSTWMAGLMYTFHFAKQL